MSIASAIDTRQCETHFKRKKNGEKVSKLLIPRHGSHENSISAKIKSCAHPGDDVVDSEGEFVKDPLAHKFRQIVVSVSWCLTRRRFRLDVRMEGMHS